MSERKYKVTCKDCGCLNYYIPKTGSRRGPKNVVDPNLSPKSKRHQYYKRHVEKKSNQTNNSE